MVLLMVYKRNCKRIKLENALDFPQPFALLPEGSYLSEINFMETLHKDIKLTLREILFLKRKFTRITLEMALHFLQSFALLPEDSYLSKINFMKTLITLFFRASLGYVIPDIRTIISSI